MIRMIRKEGKIMCGIFGCIGSMQKEDAYKCIKRIAHRGPDALEVKQLHGATLAHARLSILDISDNANQPMSDASGRYWIVYNGEVYNFLEIKRELELLGYRFRTDSDTEVILYAYIAWGERFQDKCNGMWAIAIWDNYEKKLFLSRDRFGVKPLFYYEQDGRFYFASEMKAFFPVMKERHPNYLVLERKDLYDYEATEECTIRGIKRFSAGAYAIYCGNKLKKMKWWETLDHLMIVPRSYNEQVEMFRDLFLDSCKIRMRSDVPIGTALSGGVDSSCTIGAMHYCAKETVERKSNDWQHAYVADMPDTLYGEAEYADIAARYIGIDLNRVSINPRIGAKELLRYIYLCEEPYTASPIPFIQTYGKISDAGIKVTLDGHGADELFGGYGFDLFPACVDSEAGRKDFEDVVNTFNGMCFDYNRIDNETAYKNVISYMKNSLKYRIENDNYSKMDELNKWLYIETHNRVLPTILRCYDRYSMANGLEIRMPFMDYRIVCFAFSIPWRSKIRNGYTKSIVRDMAKPFMSENILYRKQKIGFNGPMTDWLRGELQEFLLDTVHSKDFMECELVNALDICIDVNEFLKGDDNRYQAGERIWTQIVPYLWKKAVIDCA